jgi:hypothetical protein
MAEPDGVDGRHKAGHDSGGRSINSNRYKSREFGSNNFKPLG